MLLHMVNRRVMPLQRNELADCDPKMQLKKVRISGSAKKRECKTLSMSVITERNSRVDLSESQLYQAINLQSAHEWKKYVECDRLGRDYVIVGDFKFSDDLSVEYAHILVDKKFSENSRPAHITTE